MKTHSPKPMGHSEGSPEREVNGNTGLPKKDRNISNKCPNTLTTKTRTTNKAQTKQKEGNNQDQSRIK